MSTPPQEPSAEDRGADQVRYAEAGPAPKPAKNRLLQDGRDMFWSMAPLVIACIVLAGVMGRCAFQPTGPEPGDVPSYDASAALHDDARIMEFPVRLPKVPDDWQPNSGARDGIDSGTVDPKTGERVRARLSRVGYITPRGVYMSVTQSSADEDKLVASIQPDVFPTGTQDIDGIIWIVYQGAGTEEAVWAARLAGPDGAATQVAITGAGNPEEFRTLAKAVQSQPPLPTTR